MVVTISKKLMLAFLGVTLMVLVATLGLARQSFEQGFMDYANAVEQVRLQTLAESLAQEYEANGNQWIAMTERRFESLVRTAVPAGPPPEDGQERPMPPPRQLPPSGRPRPESGPPRGPRTALFDVNGTQLAGWRLSAATTTAISVPVMVAGAKVGELRSEPRRHFDSPQETAFSQQQLYASVVIGMVSLGLAIIVSLGITRVLLAPIRRMFTGVSALADGQYDHRLHEQRGDELGQLMGKLDLLAARLEENRSSRKRWLADISHELRTPVTVLTGEIEAIKDGIRPLDMSQVHSLDQEVARLRVLIDDLYDLSLSDIGGLRYEFRPVDAFQILNVAVDSVRARAADLNLEITCDGAPTMVNADARRLDQLFSNLLKNALSYTNAPGRIEVSIVVENSFAVVRFDDTAPGIAPEESERIFEPLYRRDESRSRRTAGAGLGLAICRNIATAHQGMITAVPSELGGVCIRVELPVWSLT